MISFNYILNLAATLPLCGLIWMVHIVHYPLFDHVAEERWGSFHEKHSSRITRIVGLLMPIEAIASIWLFLAPPAFISATEAFVAGLLSLVAWLMTALVHVPQHQRLGPGYDSSIHTKMLSTNRIRTLAWTARGLLLLFWLGR